MPGTISPNMLKTFEACPRKFYFKFVKRISMPANDDIFESGKNIHALAAYYLKGENIELLEKELNETEKKLWEYLKKSVYFSYQTIETEYNLSVRVGNHFLGGRIDAIVKNGSDYYILDYKTGELPKNPKYDFQTIIYLLAVKEFFKTPNIHFVYLDLKNKNEKCINFTNELEEEYHKIILDILQKIESIDEIEKNQECPGCEYSMICF